MPEEWGLYGDGGRGWGHITVFRANGKSQGRRRDAGGKRGISGAMVGGREGEAEVVWARVVG